MSQRIEQSEIDARMIRVLRLLAARGREVALLESQAHAERRERDERERDERDAHEDKGDEQKK